MVSAAIFPTPESSRPPSSLIRDVIGSTVTPRSPDFFDPFVKSPEMGFSVIPAKAGIRTENKWFRTPASAGVTAQVNSYEAVKVEKPKSGILKSTNKDVFFFLSEFRAFVVAFEFLVFSAVCRHFLFLESFATDSTWYVCGNMSTGWVSETWYRSCIRARSLARVAGLQDT